MNTNLLHPARLLLVALLLGLAFERLFIGRLPGISVPLFVLLGLLALSGLAASERRPATRANLWLLPVALFFALCLAWRAAPALSGMNALALLGVLLLLAYSYRGTPLLHTPIDRLLSGFAAAVSDIGWQPLPLAAQAAGRLRIESSQLRALAPVGRGILLALPVLAGFTLLMMSADAVFLNIVWQLASFNLPFDIGELMPRLVLIGMVGWACAGGLAVALAGDARSGLGNGIAALSDWLIGLVYSGAGPREPLPAEGDTRRLETPRLPFFRLGAVESITVLALVDLLFSGFMLVQAAYLFGGLDTLARTRLTYAEYARRGFFELVTVACLALLLLCVLAVLTRRTGAGQRHGFNLAAGTLIVLVLGVLASAFQRMWLYEQAYGYTQLRLYTHSFMIWLALALLLLLVALLRNKPALFTTGGLAAALLALALLNIANPDAMIVYENIARYQLSGKLDAYYLTQLSVDATPALVNALPLLGNEERAVLEPALAMQHERLLKIEHEQGWPAWHLGRAQALWATSEAGLRR